MGPDELVRTEHAGDGGASPDRPRAVGVAGWFLVLVGAANALAGAWALGVATGEVGTSIAVGVALAGLATVGLGWKVRRGSTIALYVALVVFELLLIPRLLTLGSPGSGAWASLVLLLGLVVVLWVATIQVRRQQRRGVARAS